MGDPLTVGLAVGGTLLSAYGQIQQGQAADAMGKANQQSAEFSAKQMEINAGQERASAQRKMLEEGRKKNMALSRAQAVAAASGGGTLDPSIVDIMGDLEAEGEYNKRAALFEGEQRAQDLESGAMVQRYQGSMSRMAGKAEKKSSYVAAAGSLFKGGGQVGDSDAFKSLMDKYG